jgi:VanZ family protein
MEGSYLSSFRQPAHSENSQKPKMVLSPTAMATDTTYTEETAIQVSTISGHTSPTALYAVTVIFTIVACLAILARLVARTFVAKQAGSDDALILTAGILSIAFCITTYKQTEFGMGKHIWQFPRSEYEIIAMWRATL